MSYPISISDLQERIYMTALSKGWYEEPRSFGDIIALCHSELSEALEEYRAGFGPNDIYYLDANGNPTFVGGQAATTWPDEAKPEGIATEMADCIIRILDWAEHNKVNMQQVILQKMAYNETRDYRHGGKTL